MGIAIEILKGKMDKEDSGQDEEVSSSEEESALADEILSAIEKKDAESLVSALKSFVMECSK